MAIELRGRCMVITGASSGIGLATAVACARRGMNLALCARRVEKLEKVAEVCRGLGVRVLTRGLDVVDAAGCGAFVAEADGEFRDAGGVYGVFANAGYGLERSVMETSDADLRAIMETNVYGSLNVIRPAVALMRSRPRVQGRPRGHVLWCSSCLARVTLPYYGAYSASKAVQAHLGRAMRLELKPEGIIVSTVHPITTKTEFFDATKVRSGRGTIAEHSPDWFAQPAEVVAERVVSCLRRPRAEVWTGAKGTFVRFGMSVMTMLPWVADACTRGMVGAKSGKAAQ